MAQIHEAIVTIMKKGYAIGKDKRNAQQGFKYRGIDDVMNTFQPLMADAGIFMVPEVLEARREERTTTKGGNLLYSVLTVRYTFYAADGSSVSTTVIGEGMDSGDKASNKAMAVAMKYAMFQTFCIPTEEMTDPDAETPTPSAPKPAAVTCDDCGAEIHPYVGSNGKTVSASRHADHSRDVFGKVLCLDCIAKQKSDEA